MDLKSNENKGLKRDILESLQCMVNTETPTPINIVNKMLDLIPNEVWSNDGAKILCPACKDGIFLREAIIRILKVKLKQLGKSEFTKQKDNILEHILKNRIFGIAVSYRGYRVTKRTLYTCNCEYKDINNIYFNEDLAEFVKDKSGAEVEKQAFHFIRNLDEVSKFFEERGVRNMKFDVIIGNPPYQKITGGKKHQLYLSFFKQSFSVSDISIMIFPDGWLRASGFGSGMVLAPEIRKNRQIVSVDRYFEDVNKNNMVIFPNVGLGPVNIVKWDKNYDNCGEVNYYEYGKFKEKRNLLEIEELKKSKEDDIIINKIGVKKCFDEIITGRNPFGICSAYLAHPDKYDFEKFIVPKLEKEEIYILDANKGKRQWFIIKKDIDYIDNFSRKRVKIKLKNSDKWKVCYGKMGPNAIYRNLFMLAPGKIVSDSFLCIFLENKDSCINLIKYLKTYFVRYLISLNAVTFSACRNVFTDVPDLSDIKNPRTGKIGWNSDWTDSDLQILFNLTNKEMEYIKQQAISADNGKDIKNEAQDLTNEEL